MDIDLRRHVSADWPLHDVLEVRRRWLNKESLANIGFAMGRTKGSIVGKVHRMGLDPRASPIRGGGAGKPRRPRRLKVNTLEVIGAALVAPVMRPAPPPPPVIARTSTCCWPIGEVRHPSFRYCDAPEVVPGKPYCAKHVAIAYLPSSRPNLFVHGGLSRQPERIEDAAVSA